MRKPKQHPRPRPARWRKYQLNPMTAVVGFESNWTHPRTYAKRFWNQFKMVWRRGGEVPSGTAVGVAILNFQMHVGPYAEPKDLPEVTWSQSVEVWTR